MQNPFRHEDQPRRPDDRLSHEGDRDGDQRPDEYRTWGGGDGGRTAEAFRHQGHERSREPDPSAYGQNPQSRYGQGMSTPYTGDRGSSGYQSGPQPYGAGPRYGPGDGGQSYDMGARSFDARGYGQTGGPSGGYGSQMGQTYGGQGGMNQGYPSRGYAPGAQIWEGSGPGMGGQTHEHHDFEPDYLHWRQQQLSALDKDYSDWRNERRQKFSSDFDSWRQSRPRSEASGEHHTPAENPIVGDVSDGGVGSAADAKKR